MSSVLPTLPDGHEPVEIDVRCNPSPKGSALERIPEAVEAALERLMVAARRGYTAYIEWARDCDTVCAALAAPVAAVGMPDAWMARPRFGNGLVAFDRADAEEYARLKGETPNTDNVIPLYRALPATMFDAVWPNGEAQRPSGAGDLEAEPLVQLLREIGQAGEHFSLPGDRHGLTSDYRAGAKDAYETVHERLDRAIRAALRAQGVSVPEDARWARVLLDEAEREIKRIGGSDPIGANWYHGRASILRRFVAPVAHTEEGRQEEAGVYQLGSTGQWFARPSGEGSDVGPFSTADQAWDWLDGGRRVHNHGPEEGPGLNCRESLIGDCLRTARPASTEEGK